MISKNSYILAVLMSFYAVGSYAESQAIGQMVWTKGKVTAIAPDNSARDLRRGLGVFEQESIQTGANGTGEIAFTDGSLLSLRAGSLIKLKEYHYGKDVPAAKSSFIADVVKGGFRTVTGVIPKNNPQGYSVSTPLGTIGVSGTIYDIYYNAASAKLSASISKGSIQITPSRGQELVLKQGTNNIGAIITATGARVLNSRPPELAVVPNIIPATGATPTTMTPGSGSGKNVIQVSPCK